MEKRSLLIKNGKIVTPEKVYKGHILIKNSRIVDIFETDSGPPVPDAIAPDIIDAENNYILPGLIDAHVHFRTPGLTHKEDWHTGSKAALAGGVTTVIDMPNTSPPTTTCERLEEKKKLIEAQTLINYRLYAGATLDNLEELKQMQDIVGVKVFLGSSTGDLLVNDMEAVKKLLEWSEQSGKIIAFHAEKESCLQKNWQEYQTHSPAHSPEIDTSAHSIVRPRECAIEALTEVLTLGKQYKAKMHICHVSTKEEVSLIAGYKISSTGDNSSLSAEVTPHHLFLSTEDYEKYGNFVKMNPPLRNYEDQEALLHGLNDGTIDMVATDHAPHLTEEKQVSYLQAPAGIPGVQTMLPLLLNAVNNEFMTLQKLVAITSLNPAQRFGVDRKGLIAKDYDADLVIVDLHKIEKVCHNFSWSKANWSPFHQWILQGWPVMTLVGGKVMYKWRDWFGGEE